MEKNWGDTPSATLKDNIFTYSEPENLMSQPKEKILLLR